MFYTVTGTGRVTIRLGSLGDLWGWDAFNGDSHFASGTAQADTVEGALAIAIERASTRTPSQRAQRALKDLDRERTIQH